MVGSGGPGGGGWYMELEARQRRHEKWGETGGDLGGEGSVDILFCMVTYAGCLLAMQVSMKSCSGLLADTTHRFCYLNCDFLQPSHPRKNPGGGGYGYDHEPRY